MLDIAYCSQEARVVNRNIFETIYTVHLEASEIAKKKVLGNNHGAYFKGIYNLRECQLDMTGMV